MGKSARQPFFDPTFSIHHFCSTIIYVLHGGSLKCTIHANIVLLSVLKIGNIYTIRKCTPAICHRKDDCIHFRRNVDFLISSVQQLGLSLKWTCVILFEHDDIWNGT